MKKKRILIISIILAIILIAGIIAFILIKKDRKITRVAFYGLDENNVSLIQEILSKVTDKKGNPVKYEFIVLDAEKALAPQIKRKYDAVYSYMGLNVENTIAAIKEKKSDKICLSEDILNGTTISVKQAALNNKNGLISAVPFLLDYCEIDIDRRILFGLGIKKIVNWADIENYAVEAAKQKGQAILFDSKDSSNFLAAFGAFTESISGVQAVNKTVSEIKKLLYKDGNEVNKDRLAYENLIASLAEEPGSPLFDSTHTLARWYKNGLLTQEAFNISNNDIFNYISMEMAPIVFWNFSSRRRIKFPTTNSISTIYYPSERNPVTRYFAAPVFTAVPLSAKESVKKGIKLLVSREVQENLSRKTGLAPVLANCQVPDHQADDVRYWIAATNAPSVPLGEAAFCEKSTRDLFAESLINYIKGIN